MSLIHGSRRSPGGGHGSPLQYSHLENLMDRGAWQDTIHRVTTSWTQLSMPACTMTHAAAKSPQSCPTLCDPIDGSPPGSPVPGILQARTLEWVKCPTEDKKSYIIQIKRLNKNINDNSKDYYKLDILKGLFLFILIILSIFGCAGSSLLCRLFSSCGKQGLLSSCGVQASHCSGFSCCGARAPGHLGFISFSTWALDHRLSSCGTQAQLFCCMWDLPGSGIEPVSPFLTIGRLILYN